MLPREPRAPSTMRPRSTESTSTVSATPSRQLLTRPLASTSSLLSLTRPTPVCVSFPVLSCPASFFSDYALLVVYLLLLPSLIGQLTLCAHTLGTIAHKADPLEAEIRELAAGVQEIRNEQEYTLARERTHRNSTYFGQVPCFAPV